MWQPFLPIARQAINEPREAASSVLSMGVPREAIWPAFILFVVLSSILFGVLDVLGLSGDASALPPATGAAISAFTSLVLVFGVWKIGQAMEGTGTFDETLLVFTFLQGIVLLANVIVFAAFIIATPIAWSLMVGVGFFAFWLSVNFVAALHGFASLWRGLGCLLMAYAGLAVIMYFVLALFGISITGTPT